MKKEKSRFKKNLIVSVIAGFAAACLCMAALASCRETANNNQSSEPQTSEALTSLTPQTSDVSETSSVQSAAAIAEEQMAAGKVYAAEAENVQNQAVKIAEWYCENVLSQNFSDCVDYFADLRDVAYFEDLALEYAVYKLKENGVPANRYLYILFVNEYDNKRNVLVDGMTTGEIVPYPIERIKDKISNHALYSKYAKYLTEPVYTEGMHELDIASLIRKNRHIHFSSYINNRALAVLSSKMDLLEYYHPSYFDWKLDFIDLATGQRIKEHKLQDTDGIDYYFHYYAGDAFFDIYFAVQTSDGIAFAKYKIKLNDNTEQIERYTWEEHEKLDVRSDEKDISDSGRYYAFYRDYDLYLHDNQSGSDILLYEGYIDEDNYGKNSFVPAVSFFVGDTLFFNIYGYEQVLGSGMYDPKSDKLSVFNNAVSAEFYSDGYIYGFTYDDMHLYRFRPDSPDNVENIYPEFYQNLILFSPNRKHFVNISLETDETSIYTLYASDGIKEIKTYTFSSPFISLSYGNMSNEYVFLPTLNNHVVDNKAYIIKLN